MTIAAPPATPVRVVPVESIHGPGIDAPLEWLVTNGLGGYASGLVDGGVARRYHALLVAALPAPLGRCVALDHLRVSFESQQGERLLDHEDPSAHAHRRCPLLEFRLEAGLPVWRYGIGNIEIEKRVLMPYRQNTTVVTFRQLSGDPLRLRLRPFVHVREHDATLTRDVAVPDRQTLTDDGHDRPAFEFTVGSRWPSIRWIADGARPVWHLSAKDVDSVELGYETERRRGYDSVARLWSPGWVDMEMGADGVAGFVASTELRDVLRTVTPSGVQEAERARRDTLLSRAGVVATDPVAAELTLAADQFLVLPTGRAEEVSRARAAGEEPRTIIAGYHWFTDWGRDTMISLEGLTLCTGRAPEAAWILRTFGRHVRHGLIPNLFPEGERDGLYHTADATLWFFHAIDRYLAHTGDRALLADLLPKLIDIVECHFAGTRFGIGVDAEDGLVRQGAAGYQLTWMDAKVGDWVVTPRRGKAVEINALWYNALSLMAGWLRDDGRVTLSDVCRAGAARARESFNARFWNPETGGLFDVVDGEHGDDAACRPNQIFAVSLPHPVLDAARWKSVVNVVAGALLTPVGLRTLSPDHPDYQSKYAGELRARDAAYHQGTVWAWLIGAFVDAWLKVAPDDTAGARQMVAALAPQLGTAGTGSISEIFDAEPPYTPRGCIAQAWSVAEVLRTWKRTRGPYE